MMIIKIGQGEPIPHSSLLGYIYTLCKQHVCFKKTSHALYQPCFHKNTKCLFSEKLPPTYLLQQKHPFISHFLKISHDTMILPKEQQISTLFLVFLIHWYNANSLHFLGVLIMCV